MEQLTLTPFSDKENSIDYSTTTFVERGVAFTILRNSKHFKPHSGNKYMFGVVNADYEFFWFFNGKAIVKGRLKAIETFKALKIYCEQNNIGEPFAYKP